VTAVLEYIKPYAKGSILDGARGNLYLNSTVDYYNLIIKSVAMIQIQIGSNDRFKLSIFKLSKVFDCF